MSLLNGGQPIPRHEIPRGSYAQVSESTWRRLEKWTVLDKTSRPDSPRFQVSWVGSEYPSTYVSEPSWPVWSGDEPPSTMGAAP